MRIENGWFLHMFMFVTSKSPIEKGIPRIRRVCEDFRRDFKIHILNMYNAWITLNENIRLVSQNDTDFLNKNEV